MCRRKSLWRLSFLLCLIVALVGCSSRSGLRIGWVGSDTHSTMQAKYVRWDGDKQKAISLGQNEVLEFKYDAQVKQGCLTVEVLDPAGDAVFIVNLEQDAKEELQLSVKEAGKYNFKVSGKGTGGSFSISWDEATPQANRPLSDEPHMPVGLA